MKIGFEITLTPAISHPMGEGETVSVFWKIKRLDCWCGNRKAKSRRTWFLLPGGEG
jgi:hypothetical protein